MVTLKLYSIFAGKNVQSLRFHICKSTDEILTRAIQYMQASYSGDLDDPEEVVINDIVIFTYLDAIKDPESRSRLFVNIMEESNKIYNGKEEIEIENRLILPNGNLMNIKEFDKVIKNKDKIESIYIKEVKENLNSYDTEKILKEADNVNQDKVYSMCQSVLAAYVFYLIDKDIEDNRKQYQDKLVTEIKEERIASNKQVENELDMINDTINSMFPDGKDRMDIEFKRCVYNGKEISQEDMLNTLESHVLPEYLKPQVNIMDTLDDSYRIETNKMVIVRDQGGEIHAKKL